MPETDDLVEVYSPQDPVQLVILQQLLDEEQVETYIVNDGLEGVVGEIPMAFARPRIWVKTSEAVKARTICESFDTRLRERTRGVHFVDDHPFCYHCGETVRAADEECPDCGGALT